ncbi:ATP-binding cassette domain-containing protein [Nesterenkonia sp. PF2B19]|uniref:ATP-binding cassette domain-containing protein n=1 Tax=Nesterenkonia sp. PF2B19 TaxID=1881858 RepID=UPI000ABBA921|nr:ATP-binding cassette domain-containing protein [Nesterenkonia sp. PF2B19]
MTDTTAPLAVEAQQLVKRYKNKTAVDGINLRVPAGETFGVLGSNGAGKTTTMEMIAGLRKPTEGSVRILGLDPFTDRAEVRQVLGVQLQHANLHDALTARELVDLYRSFYPNPLDAHRALAWWSCTRRPRPDSAISPADRCSDFRSLWHWWVSRR